MGRRWRVGPGCMRPAGRLTGAAAHKVLRHLNSSHPFLTAQTPRQAPEPHRFTLTPLLTPQTPRPGRLTRCGGTSTTCRACCSTPSRCGIVWGVGGRAQGVGWAGIGGTGRFLVSVETGWTGASACMPLLHRSDAAQCARNPVWHLTCDAEQSNRMSRMRLEQLTNDLCMIIAILKNS